MRESMENALLGARRFMAEVSKSAEPILPDSWVFALVVGTLAVFLVADQIGQALLW